MDKSDFNQHTPGGDENSFSVALENEILLMKLRAEFGATIFIPEERAPPEIEHAFLRSVYAAERQIAAGLNRRKVKEILGLPEYPPEETLDDNKVSVLLDGLLDRLYEHKIVLDTAADCPDRVLYRFIVTEFFDLEIDYTDLAEYYMHFCYEDFHRDHEYDLRQASKSFVDYVMELITTLPQNGLHSVVSDSSGYRIDFREATKLIERSCKVYDRRTLQCFCIREVDIRDEEAFVDFFVDYVGDLSESNVPVKGNGRFEFIYADGAWWITAMQFPGLIW